MEETPSKCIRWLQKDYKQSQDYRNNLEDVKVMLSKIYDFDFVQKYPDNFNAINSNHIIENFHIDYNDAYYLELCAKKWLDIGNFR